jgi:hypothetical protein
LAEATKRLRADIIAFATEALHDPETGRPFILHPEQREFLRRAFELTPDGRMRFTELCYSAGKKSGKTGLAAMVALYAAIYLSPPRGEIYCLANDLEQSRSRVFGAIAAILEASPLLHKTASIHLSKITFHSTGTTIYAVPQDGVERYRDLRAIVIAANGDRARAIREVCRYYGIDALGFFEPVVMAILEDCQSHNPVPVQPARRKRKIANVTSR